jgi:hypothetical protein
MNFREFLEHDWVANKPMWTIGQHLHKLFSSIHQTVKNRLDGDRLSTQTKEIVYIDVNGWRYGERPYYEFAFDGKIYQMTVSYNLNYFELQKRSEFKFSLERIGCVNSQALLSTQVAWKKFGTNVNGPGMLNFVGFKVSSPHEAAGIVEEIIKSDNYRCGGNDGDGDNSSPTPTPTHGVTVGV